MRSNSTATERLAKFGISSSGPTRRRSSLAFLCALGIVTLAASLFAADIRAVFAFSDEGAAAFFRRERARMAGAAQPVTPARQLTVNVSAGANKNEAAEAKKKAAKKKTADTTASASSAGSRAVCVRLCDGYHFPVANAASNGGVAAQESLCNATCPGAPTRVYMIPAGTDDIGRAYSVRGGRPYSALPVALRHTNQRDLTCSCGRNNESQMSLISLYRDITLRSGDAVITEKGFRVFRGARQLPYKPADFSNLNGSKLAAGERQLLQRIERASIPYNSSPRERPRATPRTTASPVPALGPFAVSRPEKQAAASNRPARLARVAQEQASAN